MSVSDVRAELLNAQMGVSDAQAHVRIVSSELLQAQTAVDRHSCISKEVWQTLDNASVMLKNTQENTRQEDIDENGKIVVICQKLNDAFNALSLAKLLRKASPNGQAISDAQIHIKEAEIQLEHASKNIDKAKQKLNAVNVGDRPNGNIGEAEVLLQTVQARIGEAKSNIQTARKLIQTIPTGGQITMGLLLGITLTAFGWYELFLRRPTSSFDWVEFIILCVVFLAICGSAVYLAEAAPLVQGSRQKYVIWPCCIIFLVLIGFAFFYGILHQLGYQDKNLPPLPELVAFTSLIVIAPLVTFVISGKYKGVTSNG